eukprot:SAG22_NODE_3_length_48349_cov_158.681180_8_plen_157_part_00
MCVWLGNRLGTTSSDGCILYNGIVFGADTQTWWVTNPLFSVHLVLIWDDARAHCQSHSYELASVHCQAQQDLLNSVCTGSYWIGLNDAAEEGDLVWSDDSPFDFDYFNPGEPDDSSRDADEDYVGMRNDLGGHWNDASSPRGFVCATRCPGREICA